MYVVLLHPCGVENVCVCVCVSVHTHTHTYTHTHTHIHTRTHTYFDLLTPIIEVDDSDAPAEAIATCAGIASFNSLQG